MSINHFTLHCISEAELQKWVAGVESGKVSPGKAAEAVAGSASPNEKQYLEQVLTRFAESDGLEEEVSELRRMTAAVVAGFLHPYWYSPHLALHHLVGDQRSTQLFQDFDSNGKAATDQAIPALSDNSPSASGLIFPATFRKYREQLFEAARSANHEQYAGLHFGSGADYVPVFTEWLEYAEKKNLAILEACDIVIPPAGVWHTRLDNIRGAFLKNAKPSASSAPGKQSASKKPKAAVARKSAGGANALQLHIDQTEYDGKAGKFFNAVIDEIFRGLLDAGIEREQVRRLTTACLRRLCKIFDSPVYDLYDGVGRFRLHLVFRDKDGRLTTGKNEQLFKGFTEYVEKDEDFWEHTVANLEAESR